MATEKIYTELLDGWRVSDGRLFQSYQSPAERKAADCWWCGKKRTEHGNVFSAETQACMAANIRAQTFDWAPGDPEYKDPWAMSEEQD